MEAVERALVFACTSLVDGLSMAWLACDGFWFVDPIIVGVFVDARTFHRRLVANLSERTTTLTYIDDSRGRSQSKRRRPRRRVILAARRSHDTAIKAEKVGLVLGFAQSL